jgi:hypothetical protein
MMARKPLDIPTAASKAFIKDLRAYHAERNAARRAEIVQRQLDALQGFVVPRDKPLRFRDVVALFEEMRDQV